jgi:hypothetical protein
MLCYLSTAWLSSFDNYLIPLVERNFIRFKALAKCQMVLKIVRILDYVKQLMLSSFAIRIWNKACI